MKKRIIAFSLLALISTVLTAQVIQMDVNYYYLSKETLTIKDDDDYEDDIIRSNVPFGMDMNIDIPFNDGVFQIGMNIDMGLDFGGDYDLVWLDKQDGWFTGQFFISCGLLGKLVLGKHLSLACRPGLQFSQQLGGGDVYYSDGSDSGLDIDTAVSYLSLSLNVGGTLWLSDVVGLNLGVDYDKPFWGFYSATNRYDITDSFDWDIFGGASVRTYVGISFALGTYSSSSTVTTAASTSSPASSSQTKQRQTARERNSSNTAATQDSGSAAPATTPATSAPANTAAATPATPAENDRVATGSINIKRLSKEQRERLYNLKIHGQIAGPYSIATISLMAKTGLITWNMPVRSSMTNGWSKAGALAEFAPLFR